MENTKQDLYKLLRDAYNGEGGFLDGSYLEQHPREDPRKYAMRKRLSYYLNYTKPCLDAHVAPIFKSLAIRDYEGAGEKIWETFAKDVNFLGEPIEKLMKKAAYSAKLNGVSFIVMDKATDAEANSLADLEQNRNSLPYAFVVNAIDVKEVVLDKYGRINKFSYYEQDEENALEPAVRTMTIDGWHFKSKNKEASGTWNVGCVPVIALYSKEHNTQDVFPPSEFTSIAKTNLAIFNMCSWLNDILINQTFSVLTYPGNNEDEIILGTNNALSYPPESSHAPSFIAPPADPANVLIGQIANLQQEIYRMAVVVNVTGSNRQQSGYAKAWDYEATNQLLSDFADVVESAERKVARLFCLWTGTELEYKVNYPSDFKISEVEQELANAEIAKGLNFGDGFNVEVFKRVLTAYLPELMAEDFDRLVADYVAMQEQERLDLNNEDVDDDDGANNTEDNNED